MPRLRAFSGAELCNFLSEHGCERVRQRGSHVIMRRGQVSFPVPLHRQLDRGTLRALIRQSELPRSLFE
jgi:predicted RNA binding protein YcfA (HicA-like mRNA interferase family)